MIIRINVQSLDKVFHPTFGRKLSSFEMKVLKRDLLYFLKSFRGTSRSSSVLFHIEREVQSFFYRFFLNRGGNKDGGLLEAINTISVLDYDFYNSGIVSLKIPKELYYFLPEVVDSLEIPDGIVINWRKESEEVLF